MKLPSTRSIKALAPMLHGNVSVSQLEYLKEACIAVDAQDRPLGPVSKKDCHKQDTATLHRAFSVLIFNPIGEMLLQRRSPSKITFPNRWTNACCSHPLYVADEMEARDHIGIRRAARRKLEHELGISPNHCRLEDLELVGRFIYEAPSDAHWREHELDYVLVIRDYDGPLAVNPDEVSSVDFVDYKTLSANIESQPEVFSPWFRLLYESRWMARWWENLSDLSSHKIPEIIRLI